MLHAAGAGAGAGGLLQVAEVVAGGDAAAAAAVVDGGGAAAAAAAAGSCWAVGTPSYVSGSSVEQLVAAGVVVGS